MTTTERLLSEIADGCVDVQNRKIYLVGAIDDVVAKRVFIGLTQLDASEGDITIVVDSEGGEEAAGYAIYDAIMMTKNFIIMEGYGQVCSIAAAIFQAGDLRRMSQNSNFMIHSGSISPGEDVRQHFIVDMAEQIRKENYRYHNILHERSKLSVEEIEAACEHDTRYDAEEALTAGFCDEILVPNKVKVKRKRKRK